VVSAALVVEEEEEGYALKVQHPVYLLVKSCPTPRPATLDPKTPVRHTDHQKEAPTLLQITFGDIVSSFPLGEVIQN
jgi:hypothetical protein